MNKCVLLHFWVYGLLLLHHVNGQGNAVVELFTTEGCSSCPAAEEMLEEMTSIMTKEGKQIIPLAFHVTYFNHLGWIDPYSKPEFTERQKNYVKKLQSDALYTPQGIINGQFEFIGSNPVGFRSHTEKALQEKSQYEIEATVKVNPDSILIHYKLSRYSKNNVMNIALVVSHMERKITSGENKNKTLRHFNVVKQFRTVRINTKEGMCTMSLAEDLDPGNHFIVLYVQSTISLKILGAKKVSWN